MPKQTMSVVTMAIVFAAVAHAQSTVATDVTKAEIEAVYESLGRSIDKQIVNRREILTPDRRLILPPLTHGV